MLCRMPLPVLPGVGRAGLVPLRGEVVTSARESGCGTGRAQLGPCTCPGDRGGEDAAAGLHADVNVQGVQTVNSKQRRWGQFVYMPGQALQAGLVMNAAQTGMLNDAEKPWLMAMLSA